jgi:hypothetical protein
MIDHELDEEETSAIVKRIDELRLKPHKKNVEDGTGELYYILDGVEYRLIYTPDFNWFCDIAYATDLSIAQR